MEATPPVSFGEYLAQLREHGSAVLVTGESTAEARVAASQTLFGATDESHSRILLSLTPDRRPMEYLPRGVFPDDDDVIVIGTESVVRSETTVTQLPPDSGPFRIAKGRAEPIDTTGSGRLAETDPLAGVERALLAAVKETTADGQLKPSELRVGITSLVPALGRAGLDSVQTFCRSIAGAVRANRGMAHVHLPLIEQAEAVDRLTCVTDVRAELRDAERVECLWHAPPHVDTTAIEWTPL